MGYSKDTKLWRWDTFLFNSKKVVFENASNLRGSLSFLGCKNCILTNISSLWDLGVGESY